MESPWELRLEHSNIDSIPEVLKCIKITEDTTFGRCPTSNVVIPSAYMSRRSDHCKVFLRDGALMIYSFPSLNPTFVNLEGMVAGTERQLYPGDRIGLGISAHMTQSAYVYAVHNTEVRTTVRGQGFCHRNIRDLAFGLGDLSLGDSAFGFSNLNLNNS